MFQWLRASRGSDVSTAAAPQPDPDQRIYAIGDVHGRSDLLAHLLALLAQDRDQCEDARRPVLVFLGDLIDRGDHSREALDIARAAARDWPEVVYLRGNHEEALLSFLSDPARGAAWLGYGGKQTLASYGVAVPRMNATTTELTETAQSLRQAMGDHIGFLDDMPLLHRSGDVIFAHAGIDPTRAFAEQTEEALLWGRSEFLQLGAPAGTRVVHGHWDDPTAVVTPSRLGLDTGAYYTGLLTAARLDAQTTLIQANVFDI